MPSTELLRSARTPEHVLQLLASRLLRPPEGTPSFGAGAGNPEQIAAAIELLPAGAVAGGLLEMLSPADELSGRGRLQVIAGLDRQIARLQALQMQWIDSFARPGTAVTYEQLLDLAVHGHTSRLGAEELLDLLPERILADPQACERALAEYPDWAAEFTAMAEKAASQEIGAVLGIGSRSAATRVRQSRTLAGDYPSTVEAMLAGELDRARALVISDELAVLNPELRGQVEQLALCDAGKFTPHRLGRRLRQQVITADPAAAERRAERAGNDRKVRLTPAEDGMGRLAADLPADQALLAWAVLDQTADRIPKQHRGGKTLEQLRADVFAGIMARLAEHGHVDLRPIIDLPGSVRPTPPTTLGGGDGADQNPDANATDEAAPEDAGPRRTDKDADPACSNGFSDPAAGTTPEGSESWSPCVGVTVSIAASTLAGLDNDPGLLSGYGWITAGHARALAASASSIRLAVHHDRQPTAPSPDSPESPHSLDPANRSPGSTRPPCASSAGHELCGTNDAKPGNDHDRTHNHDRTHDHDHDHDHDHGRVRHSGGQCGSTSRVGDAEGDTEADNAEPARPVSDCPESVCAETEGAESGCAEGRCGESRCADVNDRTAWSDPACGTALDHGRAVYRPPIAVADHVVTRAVTCRFAGCTRRAERCDLDHRRPFDEGGPTCPCNLEPLCRPHHRAKTFAGWRPIRLAHNHLRWQTPHGFSAIVHPEPQPVGKHFTIPDLLKAHGDLPPSEPAPF